MTVSRTSGISFDKQDFPAWPQWGDEERDALLGALNSGHWAGSRAVHIPTFARRFAAFQGATHGLGLANGTLTLEAALVACGVGEGDEVIVPALTFVATSSAVLRVNATPVVVDIDAGSLCIDPTRVAEAITERTRAVVPVHVGGVMCDMDQLVPLSKQAGLALIEDCAHAHGSAWNGIGAGAHGELGSFSFQHSKLMSSGEGGALISNDAELIGKAWNFANCGRRTGQSTYDHTSVGSNCRMTEWQAAILTAQLERYPRQLERRVRAAKRLDVALSTIDGISPQARDPRMTSQGHYCYVITLDPSKLGSGCRDALFTALTNAGVPLSLAYPALGDLDLFARNDFGPTIRRELSVKRFDTPNARSAAANTIWIHHRALLASDDTLHRLVELIADSVRRLSANAA